VSGGRRTRPPVPWPEVANLVDGHATVFAVEPDHVEDLPTGWTLVRAIEDANLSKVADVVVPDLDAASDPEAVLLLAHRLAQGRRLVVVAPNVARPSLVRQLLVGLGDDELPPAACGGWFTPGRLDRMLCALERQPLPSTGEPVQPTGRPLDDLLAHVAIGAGVHDRPMLVRAYDLVPVPTPSPAPFLTVLTRTQGRRPEALADVLLCLAAQSCGDFEVLLLAHDLGDEERAMVEGILAAQPHSLRERVRLIEVNGGGRSRPLNVGTGLARGRYISILDDDDLVMAHWVDSFRAYSAMSPGRIVRSSTVEQDVEHVVVSGRRCSLAASWPRIRWDDEFSFLSHLVDNHSPVHGCAYPREVFSQLGLAFDESLPVLEDWDLLVRASSLVGVADTHEVTAIYRRSPAAASSYAEVAEIDWPTTAWRIVAGWDQTPLLLPAGSARRLRTEGIYLLRHRPLRIRIDRRLHAMRHRSSMRLMRTPVGPFARRVYRKVRPRQEPET
jgi:hypothetical protein